MKLLVEEPHGAIDVFRTWLVRLPVVLVFLLIGATKFNNDPRGEWFRIFEKIGFGQWFRYFTGVIQVTGALLLLTKWTRTAGALLLVCTMIGAMIVDVFVVHAIGFVLAPLVLMAAVIATWFGGRSL